MVVHKYGDKDPGHYPNYLICGLLNVTLNPEESYVNLNCQLWCNIGTARKTIVAQN